MLIDATHPEETRVVVLRNGRVEEFDYKSAARKLLRGNIYLAKVTRVEPSLRAAFIDYGGNRHGFLAFSEIHPDYYQIPIADRQALLQMKRLRPKPKRKRKRTHAPRPRQPRTKATGKTGHTDASNVAGSAPLPTRARARPMRFIPANLTQPPGGPSGR